MELYFGECPEPPAWYDEPDYEEPDLSFIERESLDYEPYDYDDDADVEDERYADDMDRAMDFARGDL